MMTHRSALFIDFDNFFGGLLAADPVAALDVVTRPSVWLSRLTRGEADEVTRRWLVLRCYLNPSGWVDDPSSRGERLYFSTFRPYFTQAGIEVVDCPPLTRRAKNGADIRIAVDVMTSLRAETRYDEFVIASSDADFTPLLQVLRANDRRVTVVSTGTSTAAYEALADQLLDEQDIIELSLPARSQEDPVGDTDAVAAVVVDGAPVSQAEYEAFATKVRAVYAEAAAPINLASLSNRMMAEVGDVAKQSGWFGAGGFAKAIQQLQLPRAQFSQHFLWDADRHAPPPVPPETCTAPPALPAVIAKFRQVTKLPGIAANDWAQVHMSLAAYASSHQFNFTESTRWSRDHAAGAGHEVSRAAFTYVVRACNAVGPPLYADPPPTSEQISAALMNNVLTVARQSGVEVLDEDTRALAEWIGADHRLALPPEA